MSDPKWLIVAHKDVPSVGYRPVRDACYVQPWDVVLDTADTDEAANEKVMGLYAVRDVMES